MDISKTKHFLTVTDYSVSKEHFDLLHDEELDMLITHPQPSLEKLPSYYESDDYISHTDAKRSLFEQMYHIVKRIALQRKAKLIQDWSTHKGNLLDIGAGTGDFLFTAKKEGWNVTGIEPSDKAKSIGKSKGVHYSEELSALENHFFDVITMWHVLEHVPNLEEQIQELKRLLKPEGTLIIAVPNFKSFDAQHYGKFWAAYDVPIHLWHFSKKAISKLFAKSDFVLEKVVPMKFDSFYVSLFSEKYKTGKMNFIKAFWIGLRSNWYGSSKSEYSSHIYILKNKQNAK